METSSAVKRLQSDRSNAPAGNNYANPHQQQASNGYRQYHTQSDDSKNRFTRLKAEGRCYNCEETGHLSRDCISEKATWSKTARPTDTYRPPEDRHPNPYARRQNGPPGFQDIIETNYLDAESSSGDNDAEIFAITRANHHAIPYARPNQKHDPEDEQEEILQDMRTIRKQIQMDVDKKPKHHTAPEQQRTGPISLPIPVAPRHQPESNSSTRVQAPKSDRNHQQDPAPLLKRNSDQEVHQVEEETPMQGEPDQDVFCSLKTLIKVNGEPLTAIVDTGAACSVITKDLVDRLGLRIDSVHGRVLITADGTRHHTAGAIDRLPIELKNRILPTRFAVFNRPGEQLILGMNWLRNHRVVVDLENNRLWLPHDRLKG
ncbi:hypothetical protein BGZ82_003989, partial [Podila clonocystis]